MGHKKSIDMSFTGRVIRLAVCAVIMMLMACAPVMVQADDAHSHDGKTFEAWTETGSMPAEDGSYYLTDDVSLDSAWEVSGEVNLCLNGHSITYTGDEASNVVTVENTLTLYDCNDDSGSITGGTAGGVRVTGGTFSMYGGSITGNTGGSGLSIEGPDESSIVIVQLNSGSITGNTNTDGNGGGLCLTGSSLVMMSNGFTVSGNKAKNGGGIYCGDLGFLMSSSNAFENNQASESGGAVYVADTARGVSIDSAAIRNNIAGRDGGGLYIDIGSGSTSGVIVSGSTVTGNQASRNGGGAYYKNNVSDPVLQISGAVVINNNTAAGGRNNLYITDGSKITSADRVDAGTRIGVTMQAAGIFTSDFINNANTQDPRTVFFSDKAGYEVDVTEDGKEALLKPGDFYNITIADSEHGSVTASRYNAAAGATIELTPAPDDGYLLESITVTGEDGEIEVQDNSFVMPACDVTVTAAFEQKPVVPVTSVSLDKTELSITEGQTAKLKAAVEPEDATNKTITWSTSDTNIARVSDDGTVTAVSEGSATITVITEDGEKTATCDVTVNAPEFTVTFTDGQGTTLSTQEVARGGAATAPADPAREGYAFLGWDKEFTNITADLTVNALWKSDGAVDYIDAKENPLYQDEYTLVTGGMNSLPTGWYAVRGEVSVNSRVTITGDVNLILCDGAEYKVPWGLNVEGGTSLTIWCQEGKSGKLTCGGSVQSQAGIGSGGRDHTTGTITINGGIITARGGTAAAGIGGGTTSGGGNITINNGTISAYGGARLADERNGGDGIGSGGAGFNFHDITITGGTVYAEGKDGGAGIGCVTFGPGYTSMVEITGGSVEAVGHGGPGIGAQPYLRPGGTANCGYVKITGGTVTARATPYGSVQSGAIGRGYSTSTTIIFEDGSLDLADDRRVKSGTSEGSAVYRSTENRVSGARGRNTYAYIDACPHDSWSYTINTDTHIHHCDFCEEKEAEEPHDFNDEGVCEDCGATVFVVSFDAGSGSGSMSSVEVVGGETYTLPKCGFTAPAGKAFTGWDYDGGENKPVGTEVTMEHSLVLSAHWEDMTWATLQKYLDSAALGTTITLDRDLTATSDDTALTVPQGSKITLDLNKHTLNRNLGSASNAVSGGSVLYIHPSDFTIKNGTLTGGYAPRGGAVLVNEYFHQSESETYNLIDINITRNRASEHGGGIYSNWGYGTITGGSITDNTAGKRGGGIITDKDNWRLYIDGTVISNNRAGTSGGGVFAESYVSMTDTTVTNNSCRGEIVRYEIFDGEPQIVRHVLFGGGGVFVNSFSCLIVRGSTVITDNTCDNGESHADNAFLRDKGERHTDPETDIDVEGLTEQASIGLTYEIKDPPPDSHTTFPVELTDGLPGNGSLSNFFADDPSYLLSLNGDGEVIMGKTARTVTLQPGDGQGTPISERVLIKSQFKLPGQPEGFTAPDERLFIGWLDESTSTLYYEGQSVNNITQDIVLTAQWGTPWQILQSKIYRASSGSTITLDCDYTALPDVDTTLIIPNGKKITIDLNSHTLNRADDSSTVIEIGTGSALTLRDTSGAESDGITGIIGGKTGVSVIRNATFTMESGKISGNETGVDVHAGGTFNMSGGSVTANDFGVVLPQGAVMNISNTLKVTQNKQNVILAEGAVLYMTKRLLNGAKIGITTKTEPTKASPVVITSNLHTVGTSFFQSDDGDYEIIKLNGYDGEAYLAVPPARAQVQSAQGLVYTGEPQTLVTVKDVTGGTVLFATSEEGPFTGTLPVATDAGRYNYWYKIVGDETHRDSAVIGPGAVTIAKATPDIGAVTADDVIGSLDPADAHLTRSDETIPGKLKLDETSLESGTNTYHWTFTPEDTKNYKVVTGTVEITASDREWNEPAYEWAEDNSTATATRTAKDDSSIVQSETVETTSERTKEPTCAAMGETTYTAVFTKNGFETQTKTVANIPIDPNAHKWGEWTVTKEPTANEDGVKTRECTLCHETETEVIPAKGGDSEPEPKPAPDGDPDQKGSDGTDVGPGASEAAADRAITHLPNDNDPAGSVYGKLQAKSTKQTKNSVNVKWNKVKGATKYVIYGNACGKKIKMKKLATSTGKSKTFKKIAGKKVKKGTYYKFIIVALDKNNNVVSTSKIVHVATKGGKVGNHKRVTVKKSVLKKAKKLKKGKKLKLKAKAIKESKLKVRKHRAVCYESSNPKIATVSKKGVVKGKKKGTCYIYAYAQNGVAKKIKVRVK